MQAKKKMSFYPIYLLDRCEWINFIYSCRFVLDCGLLSYVFVGFAFFSVVLTIVIIIIIDIKIHWFWVMIRSWCAVFFCFSFIRFIAWQTLKQLCNQLIWSMTEKNNAWKFVSNAVPFSYMVWYAVFFPRFLGMTIESCNAI